VLLLSTNYLYRYTYIYIYIYIWFTSPHLILWYGRRLRDRKVPGSTHGLVTTPGQTVWHSMTLYWLCTVIQIAYLILLKTIIEDDYYYQL